MKVLLLIPMALTLGVASLYVDEIVDWSSRIEIDFVTSAMGEATKSEKEVEKGEKNAPSTKAEKEMPKPMGDMKDKSHVEDLVARKSALDERESELKKMEEELQRQRAELESKMRELEKMRENISSILQDRVKQDNDRIDQLVQFYSSMKPATAAKVFEKLDEDLATEVLGRMKKQSAGAILNKLSSNKAKTLSEKYAGYVSR